jgi:acyl carrier protein
MILDQSLRTALASVMEVDEKNLSLTADLSEQGVDSLIGLRFAREIEELTGLEVQLEWLFDYPTIQQLSAFLEQIT